MRSQLERIKSIGRSPLACIELIIAISAVVGGLYVLSPYLVVTVSIIDAPNIVQNLATTTGIVTLGIASIMNGLVMIYGVVTNKYKVRSIGLFINIILRLYVTIVTIIAQGLFPMTWLANVTIMLIAAVCYLQIRVKVNFLKLK